MVEGALRMNTLIHWGEEHRVIPLEPGYWSGDVRWCFQCQSDTEWTNNNACGDPECCGPNYDSCELCGNQEQEAQ